MVLLLKIALRETYTQQGMGLFRQSDGSLKPIVLRALAWGAVLAPKAFYGWACATFCGVLQTAFI
jgi:hypothetical protein